MENIAFIRKIEFIPDNKQVVHHVNAHLLTYSKEEKKNIFNGFQSVNTEIYSDKEAFEKLDKEVDYPDNAILFIGSSSIRLWKTLDIDMSPYPVIKRGYGGAHFRDIIFFTERILSDHDIKMVVCFVANDISGSPNDGTPREILRLFRYFIKRIRLKHPLIPIMQISITPTKSRWKHWHKINKVNHLIQAYLQMDFPSIPFLMLLQ